MSNNLRTVIREEMSKILKRADSVDLDKRNRKDRMKPADNNDDGDRWYQNQKKRENVRSKLRQIVAEEYKTLREDPDTSIEKRSGIQEFEIEDTSDRWYMNEDGEPDTDKIEEAAKKATEHLLREARGETFRQRAQGARKGELMEIAEEMMRVQGARNFAEDVVQSMSDRELRETIKYLDRQHGLSRRAPEGETLRARVDQMNSQQLYETMMQDVMRNFASAEQFVREVLQGMGTDNLRKTIEHIDRHVFDATMGYYQGNDPMDYEQPIGRSMR